jgi:uncharacterized protein
MRDWESLLAEARDGAVLAHEPMHGELHWRAVAWAGLRIREIAPWLSAPVMISFGLLHDCRRETDDWDPGHGERAARVAARSRPLKRLLGAVGRDLVSEACLMHERGMSRFDAPAIGACWDADRVNLVRLGFRLDPRYFTILSREDGSLDDLAERTRRIVRDPPAWVDLFAAADTINKTADLPR